MNDDDDPDSNPDLSDEDDGYTPEQIKQMIVGIQQHLPDAVIDVNGQMMTAGEMVAQMQAYLEAVAATDETRRQLEEATLAANETGDALEAAIRAHHESAGSASPKN